jgi:hypothetical protein
MNICYKKTTHLDGEVVSDELAFIDYELSDEITDEMIEWRGIEAYVAPKHLKMYAKSDEEIRDTRGQFFHSVVGRVIWEIKYGMVVPKSSRFKLSMCTCTKTQMISAELIKKKLIEHGADSERLKDIVRIYLENFKTLDQLAKLTIEQAKTLYPLIKVGDVLKTNIAFKQYICNWCENKNIITAILE